MVIGSALQWRNAATVAISIALAFVFGYAFTMVPLTRAGLSLAAATRLALAADTLSIAVMEIVDNAIMLVMPGAMEAGLSDLLFWGTLVVALILAGVAAYPVNKWLIRRGEGHALVHQHHQGGHPSKPDEAKHGHHH